MDSFYERLRVTDLALSARLREFGITRLADITGLDHIGIPTASCVRPGSGDSIWVYSGKGLSRSEARTTAIMECLERVAFLWSSAQIPVRFATRRSLESEGEVWAPNSFTEHSVELGNEEIGWVSAIRFGGPKVWVPADLVLTGERSGNQSSVFKVETSNGLAAHVTLDLALRHAILEILERHIVSLCELSASHVPYWRLHRLMEGLGFDSRRLEDAFIDDGSFCQSIDFSSVPMPLKEAFAFFFEEKSNIAIKLLPNPFGLYVIGAGCAEDLGEATLGAAGYGISHSPRRALEKALLELAQSRATDLQGAREDCGIDQKRRLINKPNSHWLLDQSVTSVALPKEMDRELDYDLGGPQLTEILLAGGFADYAFVACEPHPGIHCVRAIIPGVETWHPTGGRSNLGTMAMRALRR